jgi:hypothetical protein
MRSLDHTQNRFDTGTAPRLRHPRPADDVGSEHVEVIRFDWKGRAGIQPVLLVTRRRLD